MVKYMYSQVMAIKKEKRLSEWPQCRFKNKEDNTNSTKLPVIDGVHWDTVYQPNIWAM
jgi:hypothetical protein